MMILPVAYRSGNHRPTARSIFRSAEAAERWRLARGGPDMDESKRVDPATSLRTPDAGATGFARKIVRRADLAGAGGTTMA